MQSNNTTSPTERRGVRRLSRMDVLITSAIVSGLLALALPLSQMAKGVSRRLTCASNLRQISVAWGAYLEDSEGVFYRGINANVRYGGWQGLKGWWPRPLNAYLRLPNGHGAVWDLTRIFLCPADRGGVPGAFPDTSAYWVYGTSYLTNIFLVGPNRIPAFSEQTSELDRAIGTRVPYLSIQKVSNPSHVLLMGDYGWFLQWAPPRHTNLAQKKQAEWHGKPECFNMAYLDGHVSLNRIQKGLYCADEYTVLPFAELYALAREVQGEAPAMGDWNGVIEEEDYFRWIAGAARVELAPELKGANTLDLYSWDWDLRLAGAPPGSRDNTAYIDPMDEVDLAVREALEAQRWLLPKREELQEFP